LKHFANVRKNQKAVQNVYEKVIGKIFKNAGTLSLRNNVFNVNIYSIQNVAARAGADFLDKYDYIVAVGLLNQRDEPSKGFTELLSQELKWTQIAFIFDKIVGAIGVEHFIRATILIRGTKILMMGPETIGEIIALQTHGEN
jgi:hypothetical protein